MDAYDTLLQNSSLGAGHDTWEHLNAQIGGGCTAVHTDLTIEVEMTCFTVEVEDKDLIIEVAPPELVVEIEEPEYVIEVCDE